MINRQHIPGYQGHINSIAAENMVGTTYAKNTALVFQKRHSVGVDLNLKQKYTSCMKAWQVHVWIPLEQPSII